MSASTAAEALRRPTERAVTAAPVVAAILLIGLVQQIHFGAFGDVSWMLTIGEAWLDGKTPYIDFIETNPPASILIYWPPVALARALALKPEIVVVAYGWAVTATTLAASSAVLARVERSARPGAITLAFALVAFLILPGRTFDERDFFAALFGLPFLAVCVARASRASVGLARAALAGLGVGAMLAIKPPYALVVLALAPYLLRRAGWRRFASAPELYLGGATLVAYGALIGFAFPQYLSDVWPDVATAYLPVRESLAALAGNAGVVIVAALALVILALAGRRAADPRIAVPLLASLGALAAYFVQGKGWLYHLQPALAFASLALGAALETREREHRALVAAVAIAVATLAVSMAFDLPPLALAAALVVAARSLLSGADAARSVERFLILAGGGLVGAACGYYSAAFPAPTAEFARALQSLGPHPRIAAIAEGLGVGFPLTRNVDGVWVQRTQGLLLTAGARRLIDEHPRDAELAARLAPIVARERDRLAEDIARNRPDAILVSRYGARFHAWALNDPALAEARRGYRLIAENAGEDWPVDLYAREDRVGLRGAASAD